jgi:predicted DNA-binding transcriptional regulator AlpA
MASGDRTRGVAVIGEPLWTPDDLSRFLSIPEKTLREWRSKGYGPQWRKVGKHVRYESSAVRAWLNALTRDAGAA